MNRTKKCREWLLLVVLAALALGHPDRAEARQAKSKPVDQFELLLADLAAYGHGGDRHACLAITEYLTARSGNRSALARAETRMAAFLDSDASVAAKEFVCGQLALMGTPASVPALHRMVVQPATSHMARVALEKIPGDASVEALRKALLTTGGRERIGIISSLGVRRDIKSTKVLIPFLDSEATTEAAAAALSKIGDNQAIEALFKKKTTAEGRRRMILQEALLNIADRRVQEGKNREAFLIYRDMTFRHEPTAIRIAGYTGLNRAMGPGAVPVLISVLREEEPEVQVAAIGLLAGSPGPAITEKMVELLPTLIPAVKARLLLALAERGDRVAAPVVLAEVEGGPEIVREAALVALGRLGDGSTARLLAQTAAETTGAVREAARNSLYRLPGRDTDRVIVEALRDAAPVAKAELARAIGERGISAAGTALIQLLQEPNESIRRDGLRSLRDVGGESEVGALVGFICQDLAEAEKTEAERALAAILRRSSGRGLPGVLSGYRETSSSAARQSLLAVMGSVGSGDALPTLKRALRDEDPGVRRSAILALGEWPDETPLPDLLAVASETSEASHHVLAVRSFLKLLALPSQRASARSVEMIADALKIGRETEVRKSVLGALPRFVCREALDLALKAAEDASLKAEAEQAVVRIREALAYRD
jgi:HEAT repeat protein